MLCICLGTFAQDTKGSKTLVAFFSASGITKGAAQKLQAATGGTLYEITPANVYTEADLNWRDKQSRSIVETNDRTTRPALADKKANVAEYDIVYVGFPIWCNTCPTIIYTFLEAYDFKGKTIVPFATSGGNTIENSCKDLRSTFPDLNWKEGKLLNKVSEKEMKAWAESNK